MVTNKTITTPSRLSLKERTAKKGKKNSNNASPRIIFRFLRLSITLAQTELKVKQADSILSSLWYLISPVVTFTILWQAFQSSFGLNIPHYPLYLLIGIMTFNIIQEILIDASRKLFENRFLLKSINFPAATLIVAVSIRVLLTQLITLPLVVLVAFLAAVPLLPILLLYPIVMMMTVVLAVGLSILMSLLGVYVADLPNLLLYLMKVLWLATPLFYNLENKSQFLQHLNQSNPFYYLLEFSRSLLLYQHLHIPQGLVLLGASGVITLLAMIIWRKYYQMTLERL